MKTKSFLLGVVLTLTSSLAFGATAPENLEITKPVKETVEKKAINLEIAKPIKATVEQKAINAACFPVIMQSDCFYMSGTWCGSMDG